MWKLRKNYWYNLLTTLGCTQMRECMEKWKFWDVPSLISYMLTGYEVSSLSYIQDPMLYYLKLYVLSLLKNITLWCVRSWVNAEIEC